MKRRLLLLMVAILFTTPMSWAQPQAASVPVTVPVNVSVPVPVPVTVPVTVPASVPGPAPASASEKAATDWVQSPPAETPDAPDASEEKAFSGLYLGEVWRIFSGLRPRQAVTLDKWSLTWQGKMRENLDWQVNFISMNGGSPSEFAGDSQALSNIDSDNTWTFMNLWIERHFARQRSSFKLGLMDFNAEFDVNETGWLFIQSAHGIGTDIAQGGLNGPSIFPTASLGLRYQATLSDSRYLRLAVFDGVPGDPDHFNGVHVNLRKDDGALVVCEAGNRIEGKEGTPYSKVFIGGWVYTASFDHLTNFDLAGNPAREKGNHGLYCFGERQLWAGKAGRKNLAGFLRYGVADQRFNQFSSYLGSGLVYTGLLKKEDQLGVSLAQVTNGNPFKESMDAAGTKVTSAESSWEFTYKFPLRDSVALQLDYHLDFHPGTNPLVKVARVLGTRLEVGF